MHSRKHPPKSRRKNLHRKRRNPGGSEAGNTPAERCPGGKTRRAAQHGKASRHPKNAPEVLLPQEEQEQQEMAQLKAMINGLSDQKPEKPAPRPKQPRQQKLNRLKAKRNRPVHRCPRLCLQR